MTVPIGIKHDLARVNGSVFNILKVKSFGSIFCRVQRDYKKRKSLIADNLQDRSVIFFDPFITCRKGWSATYTELYNTSMTETTYNKLRENLASVLDRVAEQRKVVMIRRKGKQRVALIPADELGGWMETAHLLRSPQNAQRLFRALRRAAKRKVK